MRNAERHNSPAYHPEPNLERHTGKPDELKNSSPVWWEGLGKAGYAARLAPTLLHFPWSPTLALSALPSSHTGYATLLIDENETKILSSVSIPQIRLFAKLSSGVRLLSRSSL